MAAPGAPAALFDVRTLTGYTPLPAALSPSGAAAARRAAGALCNALVPLSARSGASDGSEDTSWVKTDEDVFDYFQRHGTEAQTQYFFLLPAAEAPVRLGPGAEPATAAAEFFLRVVPSEKIAHAAVYFIFSPRQVVRVDAQRGAAAGARQTETMPMEQWRAHKRAFLSLRRLTFFNCFGQAKVFARWRRTARGCVLLRRRRALAGALMPAGETFGAALLGAQATLEGRLRAVRAAAVQPGRRFTAEEWREQQGAYRTRRVQPELDEALAELVRAAEAAAQQVEAEAAEFERTVQPSELTDRIGVDLHAATSKARARSMQQIKLDKIERAAAYTRSLARRSQLPRFLRMLDLRLRTGLADMAAASVAAVADVLRAAAPGLAARERGRASSDSEAPATSRSSSGAVVSRRSSAGPAFFCSVVLADDGGIGFSPSEADWTAAVEEEVITASLHLAGSVPALLSLPAFEHYRTLLADVEWWEQQGGTGQRAVGAAEQAQQHPVFADAAAELRSLLAGSFAAARALAQQYQQYQDIRCFGAEFDFEQWAASQREALDLPATDAMLGRLRGWQEQLEGMPLSGVAGLLHVDAAGLKEQLAPVVATAQEQVTGLLLRLAGERCRAALGELAMWREVAGARPLELEGFLPWSAQLEAMQAGLAERLAAAEAVDAAFELVLTYACKLPTADAVKRDDLHEACAALPAELADATTWAAEQRGTHAVAVEQQAAALAEEAIMLESEVQVGQFVDPGVPLAEVLADVELLAARVAQMTAQAEELGAVQAALGQPAGAFLEVEEAAVAAQHCIALWHLVSDAEALQAQLAEPLDGDTPRDAAATVAALQERLAGLRGTGDAPHAVWVRASTALYACRAALGE
ncbi:hypothetical protein ABPG75_009898 [Micractinium tetrahymenae]